MIKEFLSMFSTFVLFVGGTITITESVNKLFKVENKRTKLFVSWIMSIALACLGFALQLGFFADCGSIDTWQGWVKAVMIGLGCALAANKIYDREEIWQLLEWLFSFFKKDGKYIRVKMNEELKEKRMLRK